MLNDHRRNKPLHAVGDELHYNRLAIKLLNLAQAVPKRDRARRPLAPLANRAFPEPAQIKFQSLIGTLHREKPKHEARNSKQAQITKE